MAMHSSILPGRISWTGDPDGQQSMGLQRVRCNWAHSLQQGFSHYNAAHYNHSGNLKKPKGQPRWRTKSLGRPVSFLHLLLIMSCHPRGHVKVPSLAPTYVWVRPLITFTEPGSVFSEHTPQFAIVHSWVWYLLLSPDCDGRPSRWAPILSTSWYSDPVWPLPTMHWYQDWILWPTAYGRSDGRPLWRLDFKGCPGGPVAKTPCSQCRGAGFNLD